jgi:hypothetical protein
VSDTNFSDEFFNRWEHLISSVEISDVPIRFIKSINASFSDGQSHSFDIKVMLEKGMEFQEIETLIEAYLELNADDIDCVDFHLNITAIAEEVETETNKLLD